MDRVISGRTMFRHWRIQVSIIILAMLIATVAMWWRSFTWLDNFTLHYSNEGILAAFSCRGYIEIDKIGVIDTPQQWFTHWSSESMEDFIGLHEPRRAFETNILGFSGSTNIIGWDLTVPYWFPAVSMAVLIGLPWCWRRFNFSLRTFFIAFTVLAVVLGFIGWVFR